jgi:hypothetical protein
MATASITGIPRVAVKVNYANSAKGDARETFLTVYRDTTGRTGALIPEGKQYITLCADQHANDPLCEIEQLKREGLKLYQYVGIDIDPAIIESNREQYPSVRFINGDWLKVIQAMEPFNPAIIHFDSKVQADNELWIGMLASTMELAPAGCFIAANFVTHNPYSGERVDLDRVTERLADYLGTGLNDWSSCGQFTYIGDGCRAEMGYLMFRRVS